MDENKNNNAGNTAGKKKRKTIIIVVSIVSAVIIIGLVVFFALTCNKSTPAETPTTETATELNIETHGLTGSVIELTDKQIVMTSGSLTAVFDIDENTVKDKDLAVGDIAMVTYYGDLFEEPYAVAITVNQHQAVKTKEISGQVSEKSDNSIKVAVASSTGFTFTTNKDTKITGKAKEVNVGDEVKLTYTGTLGKSPVAAEIEVTKVGDNSIYKKINVTVEKISKDSFTAKSGKNQYTFYTTSKTKYTGDKFEAGCEATVRYKGDINKKPEVDSVYVTKKAPIKPTTKPTTAPTTSPTTKPTEAPSEETQETEPVEDEYISESGCILSWADNTCKVDTIDHGTLTLSISENLDIAVGYFPRENDIVHIIFGKHTNVLTEIQLLTRGAMAGEATVISWSDDKCTLKLTEKDAETFKKTFPDYQIDDDTVTVSIDSEAAIPELFKPEKDDEIQFVVVDNLNGVYLIYADKAADEE